MPTDCPHDVSELERELELYLGREYQSSQAPISTTIRVRNPEGKDVDMTIDVNVDQRTATVTSSPFTYICDGEEVPFEDAPTIITGVKRKGMILTGTTAQKTGLSFPKPESINIGLQLEVRPSNEKKLVVKITKVPWGLGVMEKIEEKEKAKCTKLKERVYILLDSTGFQKVTDLINRVPESSELELGERADDELELNADIVDELEAELESVYGDDSEFEKAEEPLRTIGVDELQVGDIILSTTRQLLSKTIRVLSGSRVSHTALYVGDGDVVEAIDGGVTRHSVEEATQDDKYALALRYPGLNAAQWQAIRNFSMQKVGMPFDGWGVVRAGLGRPKKGSDDRFFCSELVIAAYAEAGIKLFDSAQKRPGDVDELSGTLLTYLGHLKLTKHQARKLARADAGELEFDEEESDDEVSAEEDSDDLDEELDALENPEVEERFAHKLRELADREFESESELDEELDRGLDAMEREYFVKRVRRKRRKGKGKGVFGKILKAGAKIAGKLASATPVGSLIKAGTQIVRGNANGALRSLAKAAVGAVLPPGVGAVATTALDALGGDEGEVKHRRRRAIRRVARIARDTYRELADTLPEDYDHPLVANEVARRVVRRAMIRNRVPLPRRHPVGGHAPERHPGVQAQSVHRRVIRVRPDEEVLLIGGE